MAIVKALSSFEHGGPRKRNAQFDVSEAHAKALASAGLVKIVESQDEAAPKNSGEGAPALSPSRRGRKPAAK